MISDYLKIYLTEFTAETDDKIYAGPNIFATDFDSAQEIADTMGLIVIGELTDIVSTELTGKKKTIH